MGVLRTNYREGDTKEVDENRFIEKAVVRAVVSGGSIVVILPKSGRRLVF